MSLPAGDINRIVVYSMRRQITWRGCLCEREFALLVCEIIVIFVHRVREGVLLISLGEVSPRWTRESALDRNVQGFRSPCEEYVYQER
jgi:hypothetical protein